MVAMVAGLLAHTGGASAVTGCCRVAPPTVRRLLLGVAGLLIDTRGLRPLLLGGVLF